MTELQRAHLARIRDKLEALREDALGTGASSIASSCLDDIAEILREDVEGETVVKVLLGEIAEASELLLFYDVLPATASGPLIRRAVERRRDAWLQRAEDINDAPPETDKEDVKR